MQRVSIKTVQYKKWLLERGWDFIKHTLKKDTKHTKSELSCLLFKKWGQESHVITSSLPDCYFEEQVTGYITVVAMKIFQSTALNPTSFPHKIRIKICLLSW
jgi:hypothetical protein